MPVTYQISAPNLGAVVANLGEVGKARWYWPAIDRLLDRAGAYIVADAQQNAPVASGAMQQGISHRQTAGHTVTVTAKSDHTSYVAGWFDETKDRTTPHMVDADGLLRLADWARAKGVTYGVRYGISSRRRLPPPGKTLGGADMEAAEGIAWSIYMKGTPIVPFLADAIEHSRGQIATACELAAKDMQTAFQGGTP